MNKIISTKRTSAIFLAIVLVIGTIATILPSFMTIGAAQAQPYYGMDSYDKPYGKDDRDKSKDSSKSVSINKLKCINTNLNINGNNTGNINVGNTGQGYLGVSSYVGGGYGGDGYSKQGKGFECIINNNNTNTNVVTGGAGNITEPQTCEECFEQFLTPVQISAYLQQVNPTSPPTLEQFCNDVGPGGILDLSESAFRTSLAGAADVEFEVIDALIACLERVGVEFSP